MLFAVSRWYFFIVIELAQIGTIFSYLSYREEERITSLFWVLDKEMTNTTLESLKYYPQFLNIDYSFVVLVDFATR